MKTLITTLFIYICIPLSVCCQVNSDKYEIRATWLTTLGGMDWPRCKAQSISSIDKQKKELCDILDRLKEANFNTILFQTRLRGDVIYPSNIESYSEALTGKTGGDPGYDPLAFAVEECHKRGMELHAWIVTIPIGNVRQVNMLGKNSVVKKNRSLCKYFDNNWYLDPGNPGTKEYITKIINEIVSRYDIDGVHLDYIRYPENATFFPDKDTFRKYGKGKDIKQWRRDNITSIVRSIYDEVKSKKPWIKVSSSPVGKYRDTQRFSSKGWNAYDIVFQDAQKWLKDGIHDILFPMMYFNGNNFYPFALDWKENSSDRWIVPGLGIYFLSPSEKNWPLDEIARQIYFIRRYNLEGEAFFRTQFLLNDTKSILSELKEELYTTPALVPPMRWVNKAKPLSPKYGDIVMDGSVIKLSWKSPDTVDEGGIMFNIYGSNKYPVDISKGENIIDINIRNNSYSFAPKLPWNSKIYYAVTSVDRYGNESAPFFINKPLKF